MVEFLFSKVGNCSILSCYLPPRFCGTHLESHFEQVNNYNWDIFLGDINIPWLSKLGKKSNSLILRDKIILIDTLCDRNELFHIPCGAKLDHLFVRKELKIHELSYEVQDFIKSDHSLLSFSLIMDSRVEVISPVLYTALIHGNLERVHAINMKHA